MHFIESLHSRLEGKKELQGHLFQIWDNAINEMHNCGVISRLTGDAAKAVHDPDPKVRVREKISLAKSVGADFIPAKMPLSSTNEFGFVSILNYDPRFVNSITLCFQGGIEALYIAYTEGKIRKLDRYIIHVISNGNDLSALEKNIALLSQMYDDIEIEVHEESETKEQNVSSLKEEKAQKEHQVLHSPGNTHQQKNQRNIVVKLFSKIKGGIKNFFLSK